MADRGDADRWIVVDAASGGVQAAVELDCAGAGGSQILHPDGVHVLLDVGEGQDGTRTYQGRLDGNGLAVQSFPWTGRCLTDVAPNGSAFITVDHGQEDVSIHAYPDGAVQLRLRVTAFGYDGDDAFFAWTGGYIDATTALVTLTGETDDEREWCRHFAVDVRTGEIRRSVDVPAPVTHEVQPLGDGSWLSTQEGGRLRRELY